MSMRDDADILERVRKGVAERYEVESVLGRGGMATVFLARDIAHDRPVAIKVLHPEIAAGFSIERFLREIRLLASLQHPHILPLHDSGSFDGIPYYVMPFVSGESLRDRLRRDTTLSIPLAIRAISEAASALDYAHRQGIVHRDVKPENILLSDDHVLVADFGIARAAAQSADDKLTGTAMTLGTPAYMSPEQASADNDIDGRSDIYSLACVLFEALCGQVPFTGASPAAIIGSRFVRPAPRIASILPEIPAAIDVALASALSLSPDDRPQSAANFAQMLISSPSADVDRKNRRMPIVIGSVVGIAIAALAITAAMLSRSSAGRDSGSSPAARPVAPPPRHAVSPAALNLYQKGRAILTNPSADGSTRAVAAFQAAIDIDSLFAEAWAGLAEAYAGKGVGNYYSVPPRPEFQRARFAATHALLLDSTLSEAHTSLALVLMMYDYDWRGASESLDRAQSYDRGYANTYLFRSFLLGWLGKFDSATASSREAFHMDPNDMRFRLDVGRTLIQAGRFAEAQRELRAAMRMDSANARVRTLLGAALIADGQSVEAVKQLERAQKLAAGSTRTTAFRVAAYAAAGRRRQAQSALDSLIALSDRSFVPAMDVAIAWAGIGNRDEALKSLELAYTDRTLRPLVRDPVFDFLKSDPRYKALLRRMNLPD